MSKLLMRWKAPLLLIVVVIAVTDVHSVPLAEGMSEGRYDSAAVYHTAFNIRKSSGDYKLIVILVEFTDIKHVTSRDRIDEMVFGKMSKYWREVSYGQFNVVGETRDWINIGHEEAYYGKDTDPKDPGSDQRDSELVEDACGLTIGVDFGQYQDIMVIHAGHGQDTDDENRDLLWPSGYWSGLDASCGGKKFTNGGATSEITKEGVVQAGTFAHEFGHTIGLPDLYNVDPKKPNFWETGMDYVGFWSLMADGNWGGPDHDGSSPLGLEAWSRIKLGWLTSVSAPLTSEGFAQTLNPIGDADGTRALKLASGRAYYLIEVRQKTGVDQYLPDSGVLITRIDETKESGEGIVKVMDCHPATKTIADATCKLNESWSEKSESIYLKVIGKQGSSFVVAVGNKPITTLRVYTVELSLSGVPSSASATINVDGTEYGAVNGIDEFTLLFPVGSNHTVTLSQYVAVGEDVRYYAPDNTFAVTAQATHMIRYLQQNRLLIETAAGTSEEWLTPDQTETIGPYDEIIQVDEGTRYLFTHITVDGTVQKPRSVTLTMDRPHTVKVSYTKQYLLSIESEFGKPKGEGWYDAGSNAEYSVVSPDGFLIQHVFVSWTGDVNSSEPDGRLRMTRPYGIKAKWRDDYTQLIPLIAVLIALVVAVVLWTSRGRGRLPPSVVQPELSTPESVPTQAYLGISRWCINCGEQISHDSVFCEHCGAQQPETV